MAQATANVSPFKRWLLKGYLKEPEGPYEGTSGQHHQSPWYKVMCLTGVDYFSTLGYIPAIAVGAAGALSPIAMLALVALTLFGALPMYKRVAEESPHGDGSISMLEKLLPWWQGKLFVLALVGFAATGFIITITLSASDAAVHIIENQTLRHYLEGREVIVTLGLIAALCGVFLMGFSEAVGIAVAIVAVYLVLNAVVIGSSLMRLVHTPQAISDWSHSLFTRYPSPVSMAVAVLLVFPKLALGLSGFETGVLVMPLVKGDPGEREVAPKGRIRNTKKLLTSAAVVMSLLLITSTFVATALIPAEAFREPGGEAAGRALAYLAHHNLGAAFGTVYDIATVLILWFAGASAMAGLVNIVSRYLPRYGMAPEWARAVRPLVLLFTAICFGVTLIFRADVEAQAGAYATGVLALMTSATVAVTLSAMRAKQKGPTIAFGLITVVFVYAMSVTMLKQPDGIRIAGMFILTIVVVSLFSRVWRTLELRVERVDLDMVALNFIRDAVEGGQPRIALVPNRPETKDVAEYERQNREARRDHRLLPEECLLFVEVEIADASDFSSIVKVHGFMVGEYQVLRVTATAVPNALAALALRVRDLTGRRPHLYFSWGELNPVLYLVKFLLSGKGDIAPLTREILRRVEPDPERRPAVHAA
ncbi:amino acid transporter [bacterium]|nr:MAG: amino acid transporter [bacterium]